MKNTFGAIFFLAAFSTGIFGQSLAGEYSMPAAGGELILRLQQSGQQVSGTMIDTNGDQYQVQGAMEAGAASGTIFNAQGGMYFKARREGGQLLLTLIPPAANQQPDNSLAQEFTMTARGGANNPGGVSGPLGGNAGTAGVSWAGTYAGNINGTPVTLTLQQQGAQISGQINAEGYLYNLSGVASGAQSQGRLTDPQTQGVMNYQCTLQGTNLNMTLSANGSQFQVQFTKGGAPAGGALSQGGNAGGANRAQLDQRIVGNWLYSDSYTSGEFSFATQYRLIVNGDGTYLYGDGKVAGGGPDVSGQSSNSGMTPGKWKTENGMIYIDEGYGWQVYAKYYVEGASMLLTFGNGSKQVWKRY